MNQFIISAVLFAALFNVSDAIFGPLAVVPAATAATAGTTIALTGGTATGLAVAGGVVLLKALALGAIAGSSRGRRSADGGEVDQDAGFALIAAVEPQACYRRLICDLATGKTVHSDKDVIMALFDKDQTSIESPKFEFSTAAKLGKHLKNVQACELRYSCPISGDDLAKLF